MEERHGMDASGPTKPREEKTQNRCANCGEKKNKKRDGDQAKRERKIQNSGRGRERGGVEGGDEKGIIILKNVFL